MHLSKALAPAVFVFFAAALAGPVHAQAASPGKVFDAVTLYGGQGVDHNLREVPGAVLGGDLDWEKSYFTSLGFSKDLGQLGERVDAVRDTPFGALRYGYEAIVVKHRGLQDNWEAGAVGKLGTPAWFLGPVGVSAAVGMGLSHAFGTPSYEDGPIGNPGRRYRTQLLFTFDLEWQLQGVDNLAVVTRVHHRSGGYGLIAPRHVGSNFLAVGLRYRF